ncbi:hypothetical protein [Nitrosomonas halophila]|uniref:Uncharacterized protein n=1 Tax=Nitrosomonas halophila TaxID=44576 RepID=A0A1H3J0S0_9PROT|nr:hypothetical protein [Nitrosomonas halophila]SDY33028.1 hypothetical protein SAMN05421881_102926 [Nitrosomonas halophila]
MSFVPCVLAHSAQRQRDAAHWNAITADSGTNRVAVFVNEIKVRHIVARQYVAFQNNFFLFTMHFKSQAVTASMIFLKEMAT